MKVHIFFYFLLTVVSRQVLQNGSDEEVALLGNMLYNLHVSHPIRQIRP